MGSRYIFHICICVLGPERRKLERWRSVHLRHFWCVFSGCYDDTIGDAMTKEEREAMRMAIGEIGRLVETGKYNGETIKTLRAIEKCLANDALEKKAENARDLGLEY